MNTMSDSVDTISEAFALQHEDMRLTHDLMGGTKAMIAAGERYIPREDGGRNGKLEHPPWHRQCCSTYITAPSVPGRTRVREACGLGEDAEDAHDIKICGRQWTSRATI